MLRTIVLCFLALILAGHSSLLAFSPVPPEGTESTRSCHLADIDTSETVRIDAFGGPVYNLPFGFSRFLQLDNAREYINPYSYVDNNPVVMIDPDGNHSGTVTKEPMTAGPMVGRLVNETYARNLNAIVAHAEKKRYFGVLDQKADSVALLNFAFGQVDAIFSSNAFGGAFYNDTLAGEFNSEVEAGDELLTFVVSGHQNQETLRIGGNYPFGPTLTSSSTLVKVETAFHLIVRPEDDHFVVFVGRNKFGSDSPMEMEYLVEVGYILMNADGDVDLQRELIIGQFKDLLTRTIAEADEDGPTTKEKEHQLLKERIEFLRRLSLIIQDAHARTQYNQKKDAGSKTDDDE